MRTRGASLWLSVLGILVLATVVVGITFDWGYSVHSPWSFRAHDPPSVQLAAEDGRVSMLWVGDVLLGDAAQELLDEHGYDWPFEHLRGVIADNFVIANAEAPITPRTEHWNPDQLWTYNADPASADALARNGIEALGLANNHMLDRGPEGLAETVAHARAAGLLTFGAGMNIAEAELPLFVRTPVGTIGVVALGEDPRRRRTAAPDTAGIFALDRVWLRRGMRLAKRGGADWVIAYVHWGQNYRGVNDIQRRWARALAAAGYDLVVGHHPHIVQPIEYVDGVPVVYSLGNFIFSTPGRYTEQYPGYGLLLSTHFTAEGPQRLQIRCIITDNKRIDYQPRLCPLPEAEAVLTSLHEDVVMEGEIGVLPWPVRQSGRSARNDP